jgi:hypothetical protein
MSRFLVYKLATMRLVKPERHNHFVLQIRPDENKFTENKFQMIRVVPPSPVENSSRGQTRNSVSYRWSYPNNFFIPQIQTRPLRLMDETGASTIFACSIDPPWLFDPVPRNAIINKLFAQDSRPVHR